MVRAMRRSALLAVPLVVAALAVPSWAAAQAPPGTTTGTTPAAGSGTTTKAAPVFTGPPHISVLRLRPVITAQQGHARFMVGLVSRGPVTVTIQITSRKDKKVVRTVTGRENHPQGAVWFLVQAVTDQGYQLPTGTYTVTIRAKDPRGRKATALTRDIRLVLTPPRGHLDGFTVPNLPAIARQLAIPHGGQLVTALAARGILVTAGLRRGDVITKLNNLDVTTPGQWSPALKLLPADTPVPIEYRRGTEVRTGTITATPDWNPAPDYAKTFVVLLKRNPTTLGYLLASGRDRLDAQKPDQAQAQLDAWPAGLRATAIGHMLQGEILLAKDDLNGALAACARATVKDPSLAPALLCQGLVLSRLDRTADSVPVFQSAVIADPSNAIAQAFLAYALVATQQYDSAIAAATEASRLDQRYEDGPLALGLALIATDQKATGVAQLKKGLLFMSDQTRADTLITNNLEPNA